MNVMKPGGPMSRSTKRILGLLAASVAILCAVTVSPVQANDLFYTISESGSDLIAIHVQNADKTTTTLIGPTGGGGCISLALSAWGTLYSICGPLFGTQHLATIDRGDEEELGGYFGNRGSTFESSQR
jgi:hypothetical protein